MGFTVAHRGAAPSPAYPGGIRISGTGIEEIDTDYELIYENTNSPYSSDKPGQQIWKNSYNTIVKTVLNWKNIDSGNDMQQGHIYLNNAYFTKYNVPEWVIETGTFILPTGDIVENVPTYNYIAEVDGGNNISLFTPANWTIAYLEESVPTVGKPTITLL